VTAAVVLVLYCTLIVVASLVGGWLPSAMRLTHTRLHLMMSFVSGLMLGVGVLHMIPHATAYTHSLDQAAAWTLIGLLAMFFLIRAFHFHSHDVAEEPAHAEHAHHHHQHDDEHHEEHAGPRAHRLSWVGVAIGLGIHTAIDGVALAASVVAEAHAEVRLLGLGTFLVVLLHKPMDALSITSLMAAAGWPQRTRQIVNAAFATMCPIGAAIFFLGAGPEPGVAVGCALGFAAGAFLCIALGDLLPEIHFHSHDRLKLSAALLAGVALAYGIGLLEGEAHHAADAAPAAHEHE